MSTCLVKTTNNKAVIQHCDATSEVATFLSVQNTEFLHFANNTVTGSVDAIDVDVIQIQNSAFIECPNHAVSVSGASEEVLINNNRFRAINNNETNRTNTICFTETCEIASLQVNNNSCTKGSLATYVPNYFLYLESGGLIEEKHFRNNSVPSSSYSVDITNIIESLTVVHGGVKIQGDLEVTGHLTLGLAPTRDSHATTKKYVDDRDATYIHTQSQADNVWIINHNLNKKPSVMVEGPNGEDIYGDIAYPSMNMVTITFASAETGIAYLN